MIEADVVTFVDRLVEKRMMQSSVNEVGIHFADRVAAGEFDGSKDIRILRAENLIFEAMRDADGDWCQEENEIFDKVERASDVGAYTSSACWRLVEEILIPGSADVDSAEEDRPREVHGEGGGKKPERDGKRFIVSECVDEERLNFADTVVYMIGVVDGVHFFERERERERKR